MATRRTRRDPYTRSIVRVPERALHESILDLAAPLLEPLGPTSAIDEVRGALAVAIDVWNAHVMASPLWGTPRRKPLADVRRAMCGKEGTPERAAAFDVMSARWRQAFGLDPRLVTAWSFEVSATGGRDLVCEAGLREGLEAEVPPPAEKRIAIGGRFLDELKLRVGDSTYLGFNIDDHRASIVDDGDVVIRTRLPAAVALYAEGCLPPVGGIVGDVRLGNQALGPMVLADLSSAGYGGFRDEVVLVLRRAGE